MIYPILQINPDQSLIIKIYDTLYEPDPIISFEDIGNETPESFYTLLTLFINQYNIGWEDGYVIGYQDAGEDNEEEEYIWQ